jgi:hypothetical protein
MKKRFGTKFSGILASPIRQSADKTHDNLDQEIAQRFLALFHHYEIAPHSANTAKLLVALAFDLVPGFKFSPPGGRPNNYREGLDIYFKVQGLQIIDPALCVEGALKELKKTSNPQFRHLSIKTMRNRYESFRKHAGFDDPAKARMEKMRLAKFILEAFSDPNSKNPPASSS